MDNGVDAVWRQAFGIAAPADRPAGADEWARAVGLGALGRAAAARTVVADLLGDRSVDRAVASLALSTRASLTRQAGGHARARADDGAAFAAVAGCAGPSAWLRTARADALVGLAADNLGVGDFDASRRLLDRAARLVDPAGPGTRSWVTTDRAALRLAWVRAETALYSGDAAASDLAARGLEFAEHAPSRRHRVKTALIAAAARAASGDADGAVRLADDVAGACAADGLEPLEWAARTMLAGLRKRAAGDAARAAELRSRLIVNGMAFEPLAGV